jgi:hypothetical protein
MASRPAFSFLEMLIALAVIIFILAILPGLPSSKNIKKYHDPADDYIDHKNKKVGQDVYGSHR